MTTGIQASLDELARLRGLGEAYYDHRGELRHFSAQARLAILKAMGLPVEDEVAVQTAVAMESRLRAERRELPVPGTSYQPDALNLQRRWGLTVQLYTLRSSRNWGIGDFNDLRELIDAASTLGCDVVGLNPLHALFTADPKHSSPYSPSSRVFINILYIAIDAIPEYSQCESVKKLCSEPAFKSKLAEVRDIDHVAYEQVATLKFAALRLLHDDFRKPDRVDPMRMRAFEDFTREHGDALRLHAIFEVLDEHFRAQGEVGWRMWPAEFRDPYSNAVQDFASDRAVDVDFHVYAQWIANEQLASAQRFAREKGMRIGLYGDLAVGANPDGSEVWSNQRLYVADASVGAPPDPLALNGQDWGIPPIDPNELRAQNFRPFTELLRANMRCVGALRIDHVMSLFRLWWVPRGFSSVEGVYVHYPLEELVAAIVFESLQAQCLIIGEDLGTVPDEIRNIMEASKLYHYKVLLFEKRDGNFKLPDEYPHHSVATAATHDLPPLKAWWLGEDLSLRDRLGLYPSVDTARRLHEERSADRVALLRALNQTGLWYWQPHEPLPEFSHALARAMQLFLGQSKAALAFVQLDDLIGMTDPVNVPGTHTEHANWQRKLQASTEDIFNREEVRETLIALGRVRQG